MNVFSIVLSLWLIIFHLHAKTLHECLEATFSRQPIEMLCIGEPILLM